MKKKIIFILIISTFLFVLCVVLITNKSDTKNITDNGEKNNKKISSNRDENYQLREGEQFISKTSTGKKLTKYNGAYYVDDIMIVNKSYPLDSTYEPKEPYKELTSDYLYGADYLDKTVMEQFLSMQKDASSLGYDLRISSGYRSYKVQIELYNNYVSRDGVDAADTYSARAGYSEHQSGLCFDLNGTNTNFLETKTGMWVNEHAADYGFILRFPKDKEDETGYNYEAWHFRYVGIELAKKLYNNGNWISLESYLGVDSKYE